MGVQYMPLKMQRTGRNPIADLRTMTQMGRMFRHIAPDVVFAYTVKPVVYGLPAAFRAHVPRRFALITGLGFAFADVNNGARLSKSIARWLYRASLRHASKVFFQNPDDRDLFIKEGLLQDASRSVLVNGSGVDLEYFTSSVPPTTPVTFLLIARLLREKGVREFARAAERLKLRYPKVRCVLVGPFDDHPDAISRKEVAYWSSKGILDYRGEMLDVRPALSECTAYVLPSYREGIPRSILEAMSTGRAIITTNAPGCRQTVVEHENGIMIPVGDCLALEHAMERFILDPSLAITMGKRSLEIAKDKFDVHKVNRFLMTEMGLMNEVSSS
jgi:glycosyltransferase involved in cell wall biosynthesis